MKELKLFLEALEELKNLDIFFVDRLTITPKRPMPAYKEYKLEVNVLATNNRQLLHTFTISKIMNSVTESQSETIKASLTKEMIIQMLNYYGVQ